MAILKNRTGIKGSTKTNTFSMYRGKQVMKDRVSEVRNPKTAKQCANRIIFSTVTQATKFLAPIIDHSFEGKSFGGVSKNHFQSLNLKRLRSLAAIDFQAQSTTPADWNVLMTTIGVSALIPNKYIISDGSLGACKLKVARGSGNNLTIPGVSSGAITPSTLPTGEKYITYGQVLQSLFGLSSLDEQITLVIIQRSAEGARYAYNGESATPGHMIAYTSMNARRLCVDDSVDLNEEIILTDTDGVPLENISDVLPDATVRLFADDKSDRDFLRNVEGGLDLTVVQDDDDNTLISVTLTLAEITIGDVTGDADGNGVPYAAGIIRSRENGGKWLRSRCVMTLGIPTAAYNFGLDWYTAQLAWNTRGEIANNNGEFLDEGGAGGHIGENFIPGA